MVKWDKVFFPPAGEKHSPINILNSITQANVKVLITRRLDLISELEIWDWPYWVKPVGDLYQVTANDYRIYVGLVDRKMIVCHICRKVKKKALKSDLLRANNNFIDYKRV